MKIKLPALLSIILLFLCNISKADLPHPDHIVIVMMENHGYDQIIGSSAAPYINLLAADPKGALFTNSHGLTHPSQPNYLMLYSGSNQGVVNDNFPSINPFSTQNLGASLINNGKTFTTYSEDLPSVGYNGTVSGNYVRKHNPCANWMNASANGYSPTVNQPFTSFPSDYNDLPAVAFVIPNMIHDMHDGTIQQGDTWLQTNINPYVVWAKTHNSLLILTYDEDNNTAPNQIPTIFVGQYVRTNQYADLINHYNVLRTIEDIYGLPLAGATNTVTAITNCWLPATSVISNSIPVEYRLSQNYPNPFNPSTKIKFDLLKNSFTSLVIYDAIGKEIQILSNEFLNAGTYETEWDAGNYPSGVYYFKLTAGEFNATKKMILMK